MTQDDPKPIAAPRRQIAEHDTRRRDLGNYWVDLTRATLRFMLPLCLLWSCC